MTPRAEHRKQYMRTIPQTTDCNQRDGRRCALRRELGFWELTFQGQSAIFKHERGALYVACLLLDPPPEPLHAVALALKARSMAGQVAGDAELVHERSLGLDEAEGVRNLRRRQHELEALMDDENEIAPVRAEAQREWEEITEFQRKHPWRTRDCAQKYVRAVAMAIRRLHGHLVSAVNAVGAPHPVLQAFALHLHEHVLIPSGRGGGHGGARLTSAPAGCFTYEPPQGVVWSAECGMRSAECEIGQALLRK
jgi:hypothetical protein